MRSSAAPHAARQGSQNDTEPAAMATVPTAKCFGQHAPIVEKILKYPLNLVPVDGCTVAIATEKSGFIDSAVSNLWAIHRLCYRAMYAPARVVGELYC